MEIEECGDWEGVDLMHGISHVLIEWPKVYSISTLLLLFSREDHWADVVCQLTMFLHSLNFYNC